ncbi:MAG: cephalosporin hydroxylase family protein [Kiritimatiellae bacterium]|nr:cephalosporin hydroxylase family protein [Kiritimatiellia bacterium]MDW8459014.1 CmcI family methyltransferase [Verrucomicrobiota bacterium]
MKMEIDTRAGTLRIIDGEGQARTLPLYGEEAFDHIGRLWLKVNWNQKYTYTFAWMGRPIIQLPDDLMRTQEVIYRIKPDVIIETGIAHGGSLVFYASLCKAMGRGRVIGVDIEIRPHNRKALEAHELFPLITLIEGSSTDPDIVRRVRSLVHPGESVMVFLDSNHSYQHVLEELRAYAPLVTRDSYIVATDGFMQELTDVPRGDPRWAEDNPARAARDFAAAHPEFILEQPPWPFNESSLSRNVTHWPDAWLRRLR